MLKPGFHYDISTITNIKITLVKTPSTLALEHELKQKKKSVPLVFVLVFMLSDNTLV